ncbi:MAG: hypothetical protein D6690_01160 [Nitrospirae bacterium]|nr:MAG: hypothetical protein D6690_01160 [Nitrospirota bacterium]
MDECLKGIIRDRRRPYRSESDECNFGYFATATGLREGPERDARDQGNRLALNCLCPAETQAILIELDYRFLDLWNIWSSEMNISAIKKSFASLPNKWSIAIG